MLCWKQQKIHVSSSDRAANMLETQIVLSYKHKTGKNMGEKKKISYTVTMPLQDLWFPQQCNAGFQSSGSDNVLLD